MPTNEGHSAYQSLPDEALDAILEAGRQAMEPLRDRLVREHGGDWRLIASPRYADRIDPRFGAFGHVELAGRPIPPNDRDQWAVLEVEEVRDDPTLVYVAAYTDAWEDSQESAGNSRLIVEKWVPVAEGAGTLASFVPELEAGLKRLFGLYAEGATGEVR